MILYHGSSAEIAAPDIIHSREEVDFGLGFYTAPDFEQAVKWCGKFRLKGSGGAVSVYEFDWSAIQRYRTLQFGGYSEEWLDFVAGCRLGKDSSEYDIVTGPAAGDGVFNVLELYTNGYIDRVEAVSRQKFEKPNFQIAIRSQKVLDDELHFLRSVII